MYYETSCVFYIPEPLASCVFYIPEPLASCVFYIPEPLAHNEFHNTSYGMKIHLRFFLSHELTRNEQITT